MDTHKKEDISMAQYKTVVILFVKAFTVLREAIDM